MWTSAKLTRFAGAASWCFNTSVLSTQKASFTTDSTEPVQVCVHVCIARAVMFQSWITDEATKAYQLVNIRRVSNFIVSVLSTFVLTSDDLSVSPI